MNHGTILTIALVVASVVVVLFVCYVVWQILNMD